MRVCNCVDGFYEHLWHEKSLVVFFVGVGSIRQCLNYAIATERIAGECWNSIHCNYSINCWLILKLWPIVCGHDSLYSTISTVLSNVVWYGSHSIVFSVYVFHTNTWLCSDGMAYRNCMSTEQLQSIHIRQFFSPCEKVCREHMWRHLSSELETDKTTSVIFFLLKLLYGWVYWENRIAMYSWFYNRRQFI